MEALLYSGAKKNPSLIDRRLVERSIGFGAPALVIIYAAYAAYAATIVALLDDEMFESPYTGLGVNGIPYLFILYAMTHMHAVDTAWLVQL